MAKQKLKPCPFCGGLAVITKTQQGNYKACCGDLKCIGSYIYLHHPTEEEAAAAWNGRATDG